MDGGFRLGFTAKLVSDAIRLNPIRYKAFIGVFQGYNVPVWYPVFARKVSRGVDMLLVIVTDNMANLFSTVAGFKVRFRAKS